MPQAPSLLTVLAAPLRLLPTVAHSHLLALTLNRVFADAIAGGEMDFLRGKSVGIEVTDLGLAYRLTLHGARLRALGEEAPADATVAGGLHEFALLVARREDADTLFFQRRLRMAGETELGLYLKNFLDAFEPPAAVVPLVRGLDRLLARTAR